MATFKQYSQTSGDASEAFSIKSFAETEIKVRVDGTLKTAGTGTGAGSSHDYELQSYTVNGGTIAWVSDKIPAQNAVIRIYREAAVDTAQATYSAGSSVKAGNLNDNQTQALRGIEETQDQLIQNWDIEPNAVHTNQIKDDAVTSAKLDTNIDIAGTLDVTGATTLDSSLNVTGSTTTAALGVDGNFDVNTNKFTVASASGNTAVAGDLSVTGITTLTGNVSFEGNIDLKDNDKLFLGNDDDVELQHNGSHTYLTNKTGVFLVRGDDIRVQNESGSDAIVELSTSGGVHVYHGGNKKFETTSGGAKITGALETTGNITGNLIGNVTGDVTGDLGGNADTATKLATARTIGGVAFDGTANINIPGVNTAGNQNTTGNAGGITGVTSSVAELNILDGVTASTAELNLLDGVTASTAELNKLDGVTATPQQLNYVTGLSSDIQTQLDAKQTLDAELTTLAGMQSGTASILADSTALTSTTAELNLLDGKSIVTTISASPTDVQIPTAQAVDERITTVVTDVGGFVPIANETSFPATNPDIDNGAGTIVSIKALASAITTGSGVTTKTIANGAGSGNTVTINGLTQNTTYPAGRGMLVETTSTLHTYTYHRLTLDESGVADAQAAIDDFDERYYGPASSAPTSKPGGGARADGDMYFDTTADKMKVWNNSDTSWDDVATSASSYISTLSPAFDGSETEFTVSNQPVDAQSCIVSINGVIQKPNSGTSTPSEGFVQLANGKIKFATAPPTGSDYFVVTLGNAVSIGTPSPNTVGTTELENLGVTTAKIAADAITGAKIADDAVAAEHIADASVDEARLNISNSPTNGYALTAQSGNTGGLTWAAVSSVGGATGVDFNDNVKARFGTGNDLEIYHDGSHSYINESGTGNLRIKSDNAVAFETDNFTVNNEANSENLLLANNGGSVELYYDNSKKFETNSAGFKVHGHIYADDNDKILLGDGPDLEIYHNGSHSIITNSTGNIYLDPKSSERGIIIIPDGAVELYYNNVKHFETRDGGARIVGAEGGNATLTMYADEGDDNADKWRLKAAQDGTFFYLQNYNSGSWETNIKATGDGSVELYYNNFKSFRTHENGIVLYGPEGGDGHLIMYADEGDDNADFWRLTAGADGNWVLYNYASGAYEKSIQATGNGNVELYYDNSKKFETNSTGTKTWGTHIVTNGINVTSGNLSFADSSKAKFGDGDDLQIYHDGSHSYIKSTHASGYIILSVDDGDAGIKIIPNDAVELYYNDSKKFETTSAGATLTGTLTTTTGVSIPDDENLKFGADGDFLVNHNSSGDTWFDNRHTGGKTIFRVSDSSALDLTAFDISSNGRLYAQCKSSSTASLTLKKDATNADGVDYFQCRSDSNALKMKVEGDGDCLNVNNTYGSTSDSKLKENIIDANSQWADVKAVKVRNFNFKTDPDKKLLGVVAQEIETVSAGLVSESIDRDPETSEDLGTKTKSVKYSILYMKAFKALQEAMAKIETLETKVAALEAK